MAEEEIRDTSTLSPWWRYGVLLIMIVGFGVLITTAAYSYKVAAPIPDRIVAPSGQTVFTGDNVRAGQEVFLKHALMENGTLWGHGAYMGPDFSAEYLHQLALDTGDALAREHFGKPAADLSETQRSALVGLVRDQVAENRYDFAAHTLRFTQAEADSFRRQLGTWRDFFAGSRAGRGLPDKTISDPEELRQLVAFFAWAAWASAAHVPGKDYSYTNNFPYDPAIGNGPSSDAVIWSA